MSDEIKEETKERVNPFLTPVKIIEPKNKLPDYTFDMLPEEQKAILREHGWTELMPVQRKSIPYMLAARDMLVQSKTGSGKTGAYALPLLQVIVRDHPYPQALILVPTRELCIQVQEEFEKLSKGTGIKSVAIFGGVSYEPQIKALRSGVHVIVATPGRLMDHIQRGNVDLLSIRDLVLDHNSADGQEPCPRIPASGCRFPFAQLRQGHRKQPRTPLLHLRRDGKGFHDHQGSGILQS